GAGNSATTSQRAESKKKIRRLEANDRMKLHSDSNLADFLPVHVRRKLRHSSPP
ncbi:hypothetical protein MTO96_023462, partial [Rhipicephalus appendiculatus]